MRHSRRRRCVRRTTLARLIAEETTLHAVEHRRTDSAAHALFQSEGIRQDHLQHVRHQSDVRDHDENSQHEVTDSHQRHQHSTHVGNTMDTAEDDDQRQCREYRSHDERTPSEGRLHGPANGIALYRVVGEAEGQRDENRKQISHPLAMQTPHDVIRRSTHERVLVTLLEQLTQRRFHESRRRPQQSDHPHPEHRPRTTDGDSRCHTGQIPRTHSRSHRDGKSLKRRDMLMMLVLVSQPIRSRRRRVSQQPEHLTNHPELHAPCLPREPDAARHQHADQHVRPDGIT